MIFDVTIVLLREHHEPSPYKTVSLISKCVYSDCSADWLALSLCILGPPYSLTHIILKLSQLITLHRPLTVQVKGSVVYLTLNKKLKMIKLNEEGMLKANKAEN